MALNLHLNMDKGRKTVFTIDKAKGEQEISDYAACSAETNLTW